MFKLQTLSIPSNQLAAVNRRIPTRLAAVRCRSATVEDFAACAVASRNPASISLYEVLKVKRNASPTDIKIAYRRLAKLYHPDANSTASKEKDPVDCRHFIEIHNAYETLSDPKARSVYDCSIGMGGRRMAVARSASSTTSFSGHSSSPRSTTSFSGHSSSPRSTTSFSGCTSSSPRFSPRSSVRAGRGFYPTRRWESDQCW